jgi:predicted aspartyl protease
MINKKLAILTVVSVVLFFEVTDLFFKKIDFGKALDTKIVVLQIAHEQEKKKLNDEFEKNKYVASGNTSFERVFNKKDQDIETLISNLTKESFPEGWKFDVRVEEFTNFILLIQPPPQTNSVPISEVLKRLSTVLPYTDPYLKNVAVFNRNHVCKLYLDENMLDVIGKSQGEAAAQQIRAIEEQGRAFKKYNSIKIEFRSVSGHMIVPVVVSGNSGVYEMEMMVDTGASMSVISVESAQKTGNEDLNGVVRQVFSTAKGNINLPVIERKFIIGGIETTQKVAVNPNDNTNLLGVDYFKDKDYVVDNASNSIYVWMR